MDVSSIGRHEIDSKYIYRSKEVFEPAHEIMALFVLHKTHSSNTPAQPSSRARCLIFYQTICLLP